MQTGCTCRVAVASAAVAAWVEAAGAAAAACEPPWRSLLDARCGSGAAFGTDSCIRRNLPSGLLLQLPWHVRRPAQRTQQQNARLQVLHSRVQQVRIPELGFQNIQHGRRNAVTESGGRQLRENSLSLLSTLEAHQVEGRVGGAVEVGLQRRLQVGARHPPRRRDRSRATRAAAQLLQVQRRPVAHLPIVTATIVALIFRASSSGKRRWRLAAGSWPPAGGYSSHGMAAGAGDGRTPCAFLHAFLHECCASPLQLAMPPQAAR